jgi:hypothetical protein
MPEIVAKLIEKLRTTSYKIARKPGVAGHTFKPP